MALGTTTPAKPIVGKNAIALIQSAVAPAVPAGGGPATPNPWMLFRNSDYTITPKAEIKTAGNTTDGIIRAPGLNDYDLSFKGATDATSPATYAESNLMPGSPVNFKFFRAGVVASDTSGAITGVTGDFWGGTAIMEDLKVSTGLEDVDTWEFSGMKQSGVLTLPNGTSW